MMTEWRVSRGSFKVASSSATDTCPGNTDTECHLSACLTCTVLTDKAKLMRILSPLMSLFPPSSRISIRLRWFKIPASRDKRWYGNTSVIFHYIQSGGRVARALKLGPTIKGSLSNNLFDRKLVTHLPVLQNGETVTVSDQNNKLIVFTLYLGLIRHTDRQRRRRGTLYHPTIINSGTVIRSMTHLGLIHHLHTIIDNFSSAFPVCFDR